MPTYPSRWDLENKFDFINAGTLRESASSTCRQTRPGLAGPTSRRVKTGTKVHHYPEVLKSLPFLGFRIRRTFYTEEIRPDNDVMDDDENKSSSEADTNDGTVMDDDEDKNAAAADCGNRQLT